MIEELRSWLPNYDHGPTDYPTLVWRLLASAPGGDEAEGMGYETFNISWQEIDQLGRMLEAIQDKRDVEDLVAGLMSEEDPEDLEEARRRPAVSERVSKSDLEDFRGFCRNATDAQLWNIYEKERSAGRRAYANVAKQELEQRGLRENARQHPARRRR
jgi:hypothetical protein